MAKYITKRVIYMFLSLFLIASFTFVLMKMLPGSPLASAAKLSIEQREVVYEKYGLNDPIPVQYVRYMGNLAKGDFGESFQYKSADVTTLIVKKLKYSAILGSQALIFGTLIGIILGMIAALKQNTVWDYGSTIIAILGISIPSFVFAVLLQYVFAVWLECVTCRTMGRMEVQYTAINRTSNGTNCYCSKVYPN